MSNFNSIPNISKDDLRVEIRKEYANVALDPHKGYHFHTGRDALGIIGYDESLFEGIPEANIASFAGTGNPFKLGPINKGDIVVDIGSGSGLDALIASKLVGPGGRVIGIDMTPEMLNKAQAGAKEMGAVNVEFRKGLVEELPLPKVNASINGNSKPDNYLKPKNLTNIEQITLKEIFKHVERFQGKIKFDYIGA